MAKIATGRGRRGRGRLGAILGGEPILRRALDAIRSIEPDAQVILYGSRARGDATPESDWDLLVLLDGAVDRSRDEAIRRRAYALELETEECISTIVHSRDEWESPLSRVAPFHLNVEDDGIDLDTMEPARYPERKQLTEAEMAEARGEIEREWMARARSGIGEAEVLGRAGHWNGAVSRLYYACFDAVRALLLQRGHRFSRHRGVQSLFNRHLVRTGLVPPDLGDLYNHLFTDRGRADYEPYVRFDEATVRPWIADAERLIDLLEGLLESDDESSSRHPR